MILKVFSIYDMKAELFNTPFFMGTNGEAIRAFKDLVANPDSTPGRHPEDYRLMCIGEFDNATGEFTSASPASLGFGTDYVNLPSSAVPLGVKGIA